MKRTAPYRWLQVGDINAFFGLMLDNMSDLVIMAGILIGVFGFPQDIVLYRMIPGTAIGVLAGDLFYTYLVSSVSPGYDSPYAYRAPWPPYWWAHSSIISCSGRASPPSSRLPCRIAPLPLFTS